MTIQVRIGSVLVNYIIRITNADPSYDGFGTFTLQDGLPDNERYVCIRDEHYNWQTSRYASGFRSCREPESGLDMKVFEDALWSRLWRGERKDAR